MSLRNSQLEAAVFGPGERDAFGSQAAYREYLAGIDAGGPPEIPDFTKSRFISSWTERGVKAVKITERFSGVPVLNVTVGHEMDSFWVYPVIESDAPDYNKTIVRRRVALYPKVEK